MEDLPTDPGLRPRITNYSPNDQDQVRRAYLLAGPCQPRDHAFPQKIFGNKLRRFNKDWFGLYSSWLEYSISKDSAYCLCCYLFKPDIGDQAGGDSFVGEGFSNWKKNDRLQSHVGGSNSAHNQAVAKCQDLLKQKQHIQTVFEKQAKQDEDDYLIRLNTAIDCIRFLLRQGIAFRGHDESENSSNRGNYLELLKFLADHNDEVKAVAFGNAPQNVKLTSPDVQQDIVTAAARETLKVIVEEIGDALFSILVDEARDISVKEQMAVVVRYIDKKGNVIEHFVGIEHVSSTSAISLKEAVEKLFSRLGLSISKLRGQGYDGASNMQGEFNGLKALILKDNPSEYYVWCFAHQLQLALVAVAKNHEDIAMMFFVTNNVVNVVGASSKRRDILRGKHAAKVVEALNVGELASGQGLNQETNLKRPGDTRWGSHYGTLVSLITMFEAVIDVLEIVRMEGPKGDQRTMARMLLGSMQSFEFAFTLHLMRSILAITSELSQALQRQDQDIVNAISLVELSKKRLQHMRDEGWQSLFEVVSTFCEKNEIIVPNMNERFIAQGKGKRKAPIITNLHHYQVEIFYNVIDMQLLELKTRFDEGSSELLLCVACLTPSNSFFSFDKDKLIRLAEFYPEDFSPMEVLILHDQLETYIFDMRSNKEFSMLHGISDLAKKMVETGRNRTYPLVYLLLTLALILPVATASVERVFSAMTCVKNRLRNKMSDQWLNNGLLVYIEKDVFDGIDNESIIDYYQNMKTRRIKLSSQKKRLD
ncbi:hypothetical protein KSP39_PZI018041 [Platanthera zijinensis]|uniref:TTF-type domain-containing protein n=1 Tax=Platanthera zijinensis TaxID=2320716 RepID=A0AAP0FYH1_9ASPA